MMNALKKVSAVLLITVIAVSAFTTYNSKCVKADAALTSPLISVEGYQIKTNVSSEQGVSFRTVCKAPDMGSIITIGDNNYTVTNLGVVYVKDPNTSGSHTDNILSKSSTLLNPVPYSELAQVDNTGFKYIGEEAYNDVFLTFGYIATDEGIIEKTDGYTSYVRTLTGMDDFVTNSLRVRAFVEAEDEEGNNVIIYGETVSLTSVASIAYQVYTAGLAPTKEGHVYIFDGILNKLPISSPFYLDTTVEYGWGGVVQA